MRKLAVLFCGLAGLALAGCDVDVKDKGKAPNVDVNVEPGRAPDIDVRGPDIDVGTKEKEVTVPDVDVDINKRKTTVTVPDIKVDVPQENEKEVDASSNADETSGE